MGYRIAALALAVCLTAAGQGPAYSVEKLSSALKNIATDSQHKYSDAELAGFLARVKLSERLDDRTLESWQSQLGLGAKATAALRKLRDQSQSLPAAAVAAPAEAPRPIAIPSAQEQAAILEDVRKYALSYSQNLPDFICTEVERRFDALPAPGGTPSWRQLDELTKRLTYFEQKEEYQLRMRNNSVVVNQDVKSAGGAQAFGDFGSMMRGVFEPATQAAFEWDSWRTLHSERVMAFKYRVAVERSRWHIISDPDHDIIAGYHGWFDVDPATHAVMRIALVADSIPPDFPVRSASDTLDYSYQDLSGETFLLPSNAEIDMSMGNRMTRNHKEFKIYRKYSADAVITYDGDLTAVDCKDPRNKDAKECKQAAPIKH
ncbi:conserved exported hypothetical protein [Candidatus Sulfopaludibacter sp. SbA3]|nr:conserved exported hypothetical protein [Candidatus Sulfopaludibacter sp. SbA3]